MESAPALLVAQTADTIVGFLHRVHRQERALLPGALLEYEHNPEFNESIDEANAPVKIFGLEYKLSEVLFSVDKEGYRDALAGFAAEDEDNDGTDEPSAEEAT